MSTETAAPVEFNEVQVVHMGDQEEGPVTIHGAWYVITGEYAAEEGPDTVIRVEHCVDSEGNDRAEYLARAIAMMLQALHQDRVSS